MYRYKDNEIKKILKNLVIIIDSREQKNLHIVEYLTENKVPYRIDKLDTGDYAALIPSMPEMGIMRDILCPARVERKRNIDEICGNLSKANATTFQNELIRSKDIPFTLLLEDALGYKHILNHQYRSQYTPKALLARLNSFKAKYNFEIVFLAPEYSGSWILNHLYYQSRHYLETMDIQIYQPEITST